MHVNVLCITPVSSSILSPRYKVLKAPSPSVIISPTRRKNLVYCIPCCRCSHIYIGETGQSLRCWFGEHLQSIHNHTPVFPVARVTVSQMSRCRVCLCRGTNILCKQLEMKLFSQLETVQMDGLFTLSTHYILHAHASKINRVTSITYFNSCFPHFFTWNINLIFDYV